MTCAYTVCHSEEFDVPATAIWNLLIDWKAIVEWMPDGWIQSLEMEGTGVGAVRHLVTGRGVRISERLDAADERAGLIELSILEPLPWEMVSYRARGTLESISERRCRLSWRGIFELPNRGPQGERLVHLLKQSYGRMFLGVRRNTKGAA